MPLSAADVTQITNLITSQLAAARIKISELPAAGSVSRAAVFPIVDSGSTQKLLLSALLDLGLATVPTGQSLRNEDTDALADDTLFLDLGVATPGDQGWGLWRYDAASVATDNIGTVIAPDTGVGRFIRLFSGAVNVRWFDAKGDGSTDDTTAIQLALNTGLNVYIPETEDYYKISAVLTLSAPGQKVFGDGRKSKVVQTGTNVSSTVFYGSALGYNHFSDLYAVPGTTVISLYDGYGFKLSACDQSSVRNCYVTGSRHGGVALFDCDYCKVLDNWITDSVVAVPDIQSQTGNDIYLGGACSWNLIEGNHCIDGCGVGIAIQTLTSGDVANRNVINANFVSNQGVYGIMLYKLNAADTINFNTISDNHIDTITGDIPSDIGLYNYGAGIYIQTSLFALVTGNIIKNSNAITVAAQDLQQVPAAIAISDSAGAVVTSNIIDTPNYYGIACIYGSAFTAAGRGALIDDNTVYKHKQAGIFLQDWPNAVASNNKLYGDDGAGGRAPQGIRIIQTAFTQSSEFLLDNNQVNHSEQGIFCDGTIGEVNITGGHVRDSSSHNIYSSSAIFRVNGATIVGASGSIGIRIRPTCLGGSVENCVISTGAGTGIMQEALSRVQVDPRRNQVAATTQYETDGTANNYFRILTNTATPDVTNTVFASMAFTPTITNFNGGRQGMEFTLKALAACVLADGATLQLAGGINFTMASGDIWTGLFDGTVWRETGRSVN